MHLCWSNLKRVSVTGMPIHGLSANANSLGACRRHWAVQITSCWVHNSHTSPRSVRHSNWPVYPRQPVFPYREEKNCGARKPRKCNTVGARKGAYESPSNSLKHRLQIVGMFLLVSLLVSIALLWSPVHSYSASSWIIQKVLRHEHSRNCSEKKAMPLLEFNDSQDNSDSIHHAEGWERRGVFSICVLSTANTSYIFVQQVREKNCAGRTAEPSDSYKCYLAFSSHTMHKRKRCKCGISTWFGACKRSGVHLWGVLLWCVQR